MNDEEDEGMSVDELRDALRDAAARVQLRAEAKQIHEERLRSLLPKEQPQ